MAAATGGGISCRTGPARVADCPFCPGNERMTPPELLALGRGGAGTDAAGWRVRVVPNKYPAVELEPEPGLPPSADTPAPGYGAHEVLIEIPEHNCHPGCFPPGQMALVMEACYRRGRALAGFPGLRYLQLYRNHRREAGASLEHPHSQLIALPFVPEAVRRELERSQGRYLDEGICPFCRLLEEERGAAPRVVAGNGSYSAFIPYAPGSPFEIWILPCHHRSSFLETSPRERGELADFLEKVLRMTGRALGDPPYNYYLHTAPLRCPPLPYYHWHIELHPRVNIAAGFEMGTGVFINNIAPEEAARFIREKGSASLGQSWG